MLHLFYHGKKMQKKKKKKKVPKPQIKPKS